VFKKKKGKEWSVMIIGKLLRCEDVKAE